MKVRFSRQKVKLHKSEGESLNDLIVKALEREVRYCQGLATDHRIVARRKRIRKKTGIQTDFTGLIHQLREGERQNG
jgi:hypothetical protein